MLKSEKRSLIRFLVLYLGSTFLLFFLGSWIFYTAQKHTLLDRQREGLKVEVSIIIKELVHLHTTFNAILFYPTYKHLDSSIYDKNKKYIFGSGKDTILLDEQEYLKDENYLYTVTQLQPYYLGASFLLIRQKVDKEPISNLKKNIFFFLFIAGIFFTLLGLYLGKLFIAPMRENMQRMNYFIEDATHELNTPISTILANIEMLDSLGKCQNNKALKRIEIASKTLSHIYEDLTYLNLNHNVYRLVESVNISHFLKERLLYFYSMAKNKGLKVEMNIAENIFIEIDKNDLTRLVDNLISNAIKYNKKDGYLKITLTSNYFLVEDSGIGIKKNELDTILYRFKRANKSEGGFGIGLDIVHQVVKSYDFFLKIYSGENEGTKVRVEWKK